MVQGLSLFEMPPILFSGEGKGLRVSGSGLRVEDPGLAVSGLGFWGFGALGFWGFGA